MKRDELINKTNTLGKDVFSLTDLKKLFPGESNLKNSIKRLKDTHVIASVTRGLYRQADKSIDIEKLANQIYYPSYLSFESILFKHGVINQGPYKITLATTRHSKKLNLDNISCEYIQIKPSLFFGFNLIDGLYLADVEKALLDELYLIALGKKILNISEWNLNNLDQNKIKKYLSSYPNKVKEILKF